MTRVIKIPDGTAFELIPEDKDDAGSPIIATVYYFFHCRRDNVSVVCTDSELLHRVRNRSVVPKLCPACGKALKLGKVRVDVKEEVTT